MNTIDVINVTVIEPRLKHATIFEKFDSLAAGEEFIIHNDHDPKPLYYQLIAERGNVFTWEYLIEGPSVWEVKIGKADGNTKEPGIGKLVAADYRKASVFKKFGLDFCCGGSKTLKQACKEKGLDVLQVEKELKEAVQEKTVGSQNFSSWDPAFLADYIVNTHHKYVRENIPVIFEYTQKVAKVHGESHPEVVEIADLFRLVTNELSDHMVKEEEVLFPYIRLLSDARKRNEKIECRFGTVQNPVKAMEHEHTYVGSLVKRIRDLSADYQPPLGACTTYKLSFKKLEEFEEDLHQHIHLENNILFPAAVALEKEISKSE